jgi:chromosome segregation ATPase
MSAREQVEQLLKESGAQLKRDRKHEIWMLPNGKTFVRSKTPSDRRAGHEDLQELRHALGIEREKGAGVRREKKLTAGKAQQKETYNRSVNSLGVYLRMSDVLESHLREQLAESESERSKLQRQLSDAREQVRRLKVSRMILDERMRGFQSETNHCRLCRLRRWFEDVLARVEGALSPPLRY